LTVIDQFLIFYSLIHTATAHCRRRFSTSSITATAHGNGSIGHGANIHTHSRQPVPRNFPLLSAVSGWSLPLITDA